jgi:predicted nucleic acid-binding protein
MTKLFLDTSILIDLIADRKPFSKFAITLFEKAELKKVSLYTSSHAIATTHYLLKKHVGEKTLREILFDLLDYIQIISIDQDVIKKSLKSKHKDFQAYIIQCMQITMDNTLGDAADNANKSLKDDKPALNQTDRTERVWKQCIASGCVNDPNVNTDTIPNIQFHLFKVITDNCT